MKRQLCLFPVEAQFRDCNESTLSEEHDIFFLTFSLVGHLGQGPDELPTLLLLNLGAGEEQPQALHQHGVFEMIEFARPDRKQA